MPAARRPGRRTTPIIGPAIPATSMRRKAPRIGDPSKVLMAAKLPAAPMTTVACSGASFFTRCTIQAASPPPRAMRGASGPTTAPRAREKKAAKAMPGNACGAATPFTDRPPDGSCPPPPGRYRMVSPTPSPATTRTGRGHQTGGVSNPRASGSVVKAHDVPTSTSFRKPKAIAAMGTPINAPNTSRPR